VEVGEDPLQFLSSDKFLLEMFAGCDIVSSMGWEVVRMRSLLLCFPPSIKFYLLFLPLCAVGILPAKGAIVINEIYYDHPGKDDGYEFIELINNGSVDLCTDLFRVEFHNGSGFGWETVWWGSAEDTIRSSSLFVIGGENVRPVPDAILRVSLQNGPDALRLIADDKTLDLVAYGNLQDPDYVEGVSAEAVTAGFSLCRKPDGWDTDNNQMDFHSMIPSPGGFNVPQADVSLILAEGTPRAGAVARGSTEEIRLLLANNGIGAVPAGDVFIQLWDSSRTGNSLVGDGENMDGIAPGASYQMAFTTRFQDGYHFLKLQAAYTADERPNNNCIDLVRRAGSPGVLISEIMSYPAESCPQYIEIFNAGGTPYHLQGHVMRDRSHEFSLLTSQLCVIEPDAYLVLTPQFGLLTSFFPALPSHRVVDMEGTWPQLNHSGSGGFADSVIIGDRYGIPIEEVDYPPQSSAYRGKSLERVDLFTSSGSPVWVLSRNPGGGSPGRRNDASIFASPGDEIMSVTPNPFSPAAGENCLIVVDPSHAVMRTSVTIFDTNGRIVKIVGSTSVHPFVFMWKGTRDDGSAVPSGLYLLACEMFSSAGKRLGVEKVVVGCGRKPPR
jgi:hypothetical protein